MKPIEMKELLTADDRADVPESLLGLLADGKEALALRRSASDEERLRREEEERQKLDASWRNLLAAVRDAVGAAVAGYAQQERPPEFRYEAMAVPWRVWIFAPGLSSFCAAFAPVKDGKWEPRQVDGSGNWYLVVRWVWSETEKQATPGPNIGAKNLAEALALARESWINHEMLKGKEEVPF